jgi:YegS/Rv2252/BmrU family lipid kinase
MEPPTDAAPIAMAAGLVGAGVRPRAMVIVNARAGLGLWPGAMPAADRLAAAGWQLDVVQTETEGHATELAAMAVARGYTAVVGCGGDGTLSEIVQALAGTPVALGIIPTGTANVLAREFGVPLDPARAAEVLLSGAVQLVDVGRVDGRAFVMMASVGLDADVVQEVQHTPRRRPRLLKVPLMVVAFVRGLFVHPGVMMTITLDDAVIHDRMIMAVVSNIRGYGGVVEIAHEAEVDDAILDVVLFHDVPVPARIANLVSVVRRRHQRQPGVTYHRARCIRIETARPVPVQADGDIVGLTPMTFISDPRALRLVLPLRPR